MKLKAFGMIISVIIIGYLVIVTIQTNFVVEEYPSGLIQDQLDELASNRSELELGIKKNNIAPDFELQKTNGEMVKLSDYRGKKIFLNFWASWCGACRIEMPSMESYYKKYKDLENVEIIAVNMTNSERKFEKVQDFVDSHGLTFPVLLDDEGEVERLYKIIGYPTTYLINEEGIIVDGFGASVDEKKIKELMDNIQ